MFSTTSKLASVVSAALILAFYFYVWPRWQADAEISILADGLAQDMQISLANEEEILSKLSVGSEDIASAFDNLTCEGPDHDAGRVPRDSIFVIDRPNWIYSVRGLASVWIEEYYSLPVWHREAMRERLPLVIEICVGCILDLHTNSKGEFGWTVTKQIAKKSWYDKSSEKSKLDESPWQLARLDSSLWDPSKVAVLVNWGEPKFAKEHNLVEVKTVYDHNNMVVESSVGESKPAYATYVPFCAYNYDDLTLIVRKTIKTSAPLSGRDVDFRESKEELANGFVRKRSDWRNAVRFFGKEVAR